MSNPSVQRSDALDPDDIALLAMTCHLIGRDDEGLDLLARAHHVSSNGTTPNVDDPRREQGRRLHR